ncbi:MAG: hypothetical protein H6754_05110 [Candidatus Omnitrophica bacterium]|nr:hypothetical protein [Candidatus Omnitrophota bacterium]
MCLTFATPAHTWGLKKELNNPETASTCLTVKALKNKEIVYSLKIDPEFLNNFPVSELSLEIETALRIWLIHLEKLSGSHVKISRNENTDQSDLVVEIGRREPGDDSNGAFTQTILQPAPQRNFIKVKINADLMSSKTQTSYQYQRISKFLEHDESLESMLEEISFQEPQTLDEFANRRNITHADVFWTPYRVFSHEFGHAFGLCDTNPDLFEAQCDPEYRSTPPQRPSIMLYSNFFYLTNDDLEGLKTLIMRFI